MSRHSAASWAYLELRPGAGVKSAMRLLKQDHNRLLAIKIIGFGIDDLATEITPES
jgi:hypothetical protein